MGEAIARRLVHGGCRVGLVARRADELERLREEFDRTAGSPVAVIAPHDVRNRDEVPALFQNMTRELGGLDLIVYAAGAMPKITEDEFNSEKDELIMEVNTLGAMTWLNEAAQRFERTKRGTIVGIGSIAGDRGRRGNPAYCTSKAALATYLESLRNRLGRYGVKVVTVKPGFIDTPMTRGTPGLFWLISADEAAAQILDAAKSGRTVSYIPARWRLVSWVVRSIPSFLFKRLSI
jgi:short-subunit dehydrogenase